MRKYLLFFLFFSVCSLSGLSQRYADSLKNIIRTAKDTQRINALNLLSRDMLYGAQVDGYMDSAGKLSREAQSLAIPLHYEKGQGNALLNLAIIRINIKKDDFHRILSALQTALPLLKRSGDWYSVAACYGTTGNCYHHLGENIQAIAFYDSAVLLFQQLHDTVSSIYTMIDKGHSYFDLGNFALAYKTFHQAIDLTPKKDTVLLSYAYCNTAKLFNGAGLPENAIAYVNKVKEFYPSLTPQQQNNIPWPVNWSMEISGEAYLQLNQTDSAYAVAAWLNIPLDKQDTDDNLFYGHLYSALHQYDKALVYFRQGYQQSLHASHEISLARHANELAVVYMALDNFPQAVYFANEAVRVSEKIHALLEQKNAIGTLSGLYAARKDYTKAYHYTQLYKSLNDSLAPDEYKRKLALIQVRDQLEMQKKEAQLLSSQNQISQQQIKIQESALKRRSLLLYIFIAALLVMVLLGILIYRNIRLKRRKMQLQQLMDKATVQQKLTELEKEKSSLEMQALRAQMNPHFIFNCLSSINRFILINKTDEASDYLTKFSRLIRMVLHNSEKPLISLETELESLRLYLDLEKLRFKNAFEYKIHFITATHNGHLNCQDVLNSHDVYIPPMLIQPFAENAIWHGLMHKKGNGCLEIQLCLRDKILACSVIDNGIGRNLAAAFKSRTSEKNKSLGVRITAGRLALLNNSKNETAVFNIEDLMDEDGNACGTKVELTIPYKDPGEMVVKT